MICHHGNVATDCFEPYCQARGWKEQTAALRDLLEQWHESWKKGDEGDHLDAPTTALLADAGQAAEDHKSRCPKCSRWLVCAMCEARQR